MSSEADRLVARTEGGRIGVYVPTELAEEWTQTGRISLKYEQYVEGEQTLEALVEKDLGCQHRPTENEEDMFDHLRPEPPGSTA